MDYQLNSIIRNQTGKKIAFSERIAAEMERWRNMGIGPFTRLPLNWSDDSFCYDY